MDLINSSVEFKDIVLSFLMGIRFDIVISSYVLSLPVVILSICSILKIQSVIIFNIITYYISTLFSIAFLVSAIDIPYFNQFFSRFSISAFEWADSPLFILKMIIEEPRYWSYIIPFLIIIYFFIRATKLIFKTTYDNNDNRFKIPFLIIFLGLIFIGMRGRLDQKSPIRVGTAYFSNNSFLNQLGLNPNYTLIDSYLDSRKIENKKIQLMNDTIAISNVRKYFNTP